MIEYQHWYPIRDRGIWWPLRIGYDKLLVFKELDVRINGKIYSSDSEEFREHLKTARAQEKMWEILSD